MLTTTGMIVTVVLVFGLGYGVSGALWAKLVVGMLSAGIGIGLMIYFSPLGKWRFDKELWFEQINYCWPLMATAIVGVVNIKLGEVMISSYFSKEIYAVYSTGALELPLIALFTSSLASAIMPNMVVEVGKGLPLNALNLWHQATRKSSLLIFPTFAFFLVCGYDFIVLLYTQEYSKAAWPFLIYLCRLPIRVAIYASIFRALGCTRPIAISALIDLCVNFCISVSLLFMGQHSLLSYIGPSIGTFFGTISAVGYLLVTLCGKLDIRFVQIMRWRELGRLFGLSLLCGVILWFLPMPVDSLLLKLVIRFALYIVMFFLSLLLTRSIHPDEWELLLMPLAIIRKWMPKRV
jgi:O-antigen/teichoic acid export membrane protein